MAVFMSGSVEKESFRLEGQPERWLHYSAAPRPRILYEDNARSMTRGARSLRWGGIGACDVEVGR